MNIGNSIKGFLTSIKNIMIILLVLVIVGGVYTFIQNRNSIINDYNTILSDTTDYYVQQRIIDGRVISEQKQKITGLSSAVATGEIKIKDLEDRNFKSVNTIIRLRTVNQILNDSIEYLGEPHIIVIRDSTGIPSNYMKIPIDFGEEDKWYSINGNVNKHGLFIREMKAYSDPTIYIGKQWNSDRKVLKFLKGTSQVITYENANPHIQVLNMDNNVIIEPDKWYEKGWFKFLLGGVAGTGTAIMLNK